ncbi:MAG: CPBP family intramembrane metalloprotease [Planctomycetes bacterium]|nr:CPBP family intramembrane metalloprotease [Planctomycetota bacterium]
MDAPESIEPPSRPAEPPGDAFRLRQGHLRAAALLFAAVLFLQLALFTAPGLTGATRQAPADPPPELDLAAVFDAEHAPWPATVVVFTFLALNAGGGLFCAYYALRLTKDESIRECLKLGTPRTPAHVYLIDVFAFIALAFVLRILFQQDAIKHTPSGWWVATQGGVMPAGLAGLLVSLGAQFAAYTAGLAGVAWAARARAAADEALAGIWPPWRNGAESDLPGDALRGVAGYLLVSWLLIALNLFSGVVLKALGRPTDTNPVLDLLQHELSGAFSWGLVALLVVAASAGAAFFEELIFRGLFYHALRRYLGVWGAAMVVAAIFALIHFVWSNLLSLFVLSLVLTWLYERTGRLWASMWLHFVNNLMALLVAVALASPAH